VLVSGEDGRQALELALRIMHAIERSMPVLAGSPGA